MAHKQMMMIAICDQELLLYSVVFCCIALYCTAWRAAIMEDSLLCTPPGVIYEGLYVVCLYESLSVVCFTKASLWCPLRRPFCGVFTKASLWCAFTKASLWCAFTKASLWCLYEGLFVVSLRRPICGVPLRRPLCGVFTKAYLWCALRRPLCCAPFAKVFI